MEIVHLVLGKANPNRMNGVNKVVYQLTVRQNLSGRKASVWGITSDLSHNYGERSFETLLFKAYKNPFKIDKVLKAKLLERKNDIVIHLHGGWIPIYFTLSIVLKRYKIPFVITPHGAYNLIAMERSRFFKKFYFYFFEKRLLKNAKYIHSLGQSEVNGLATIYSNEKSKLIPYGFEFPTCTYEKKINKNEFIVGYVGRIDIYTKGLDLLFKAFSLFEKNANNVKLVIVGDGSELITLKELAVNIELQNIDYLGSKYDEEKNKIINDFDLFVHTSRNEGIPTAVIEAASFSVPSLITIATNLEQLVRSCESGYIVKDEDVDSIYKGLLIAYQDFGSGELIRKGENAAQMVKEKFGWQVIVEEYDQLYK